MILKFSKYSVYFFLGLFLLFALFGYFYLGYHSSESGIYKNLEVNLNKEDLFRILKNNLLLGVIVLFGFLTFNLTNLSFIVFNGLLYGIAINKYSLEFGIAKTLLAILPHGIVEYTALAMLFSCSVDINITLYQFFLKSNNEFINYKTIRKIIVAFALIALSSLIELYITPLILQSI